MIVALKAFFEGIRFEGDVRIDSQQDIYARLL